MDPSWGLLLVVVLCTLYAGAVRSLSFLAVQTQRGAADAREANELKAYTAVLLPVLGSVMLVVLFFYLDWLSTFLVIVFSISSFVSVTYALSPMFDLLASKLRLPPEYQYLTLPQCLPFLVRTPLTLQCHCWRRA